MKSIYLFLLLFLMGSVATAQQQSDSDNQHMEVQKKLIPYTNPLLNVGDSRVTEETTRELGDLEKETLRRISDVYRIHVLAIDAQIQDDLVQAEVHINDAFAAIQALMDDYPEIQNNQRFAALYRSVRGG